MSLFEAAQGLTPEESETLRWYISYLEKTQNLPPGEAERLVLEMGLRYVVQLIGKLNTSTAP